MLPHKGGRRVALPLQVLALATLSSDRLREKGEFGFLVTMDLPTRPMRDEIAAAGKYRHPLLNREDDRLQVVTVAESLAGKRLDLPMARLDAVKSAEALGELTGRSRSTCNDIAI